MARPVKALGARGSDAFRRDIDGLGRLRTAILVDPSIDTTQAGRMKDAIDLLISDLAKLAQKAAA